MLSEKDVKAGLVGAMSRTINLPSFQCELNREVILGIYHFMECGCPHVPEEIKKGKEIIVKCFIETPDGHFYHGSHPLGKCPGKTSRR